MIKIIKRIIKYLIKKTSKFRNFISNNPVISPILKRKRKVALMLVICIVLTSFANYLIESKREKMSMTLKYNQISSGLYPNNSRFDMFELSSNTVLNRAIELGNLDMDANYLKSRISIYPKLSNGTFTKVTSAVKEGNNYSYIADEYTITYSQKNKFMSNDTEKVLRSVAMAYTEYFKKNYVENNSLFTEQLNNLNQYEYVEIADILSARTKRLQRYINNRISENSDFKSSDGISFQDLGGKLDNIMSISLENYRGFVEVFGISKDKQNYINKLNSLNQNLERKKAKNDDAHDVRTFAIDLYDTYLIGAWYIPSVDRAGGYYMNKTKTGIDYLTDEAYDYAMRSKEFQKSIDANEKIINNLNSSGATEVDIDNANKMIESLTDKLDDFCKQAKKVDDEYLEYKSRDYISFKVNSAGFLSDINKKIVLAVTLVFLIALVLYYFLKDTLLIEEKLMRKKKEEDEAEDENDEEEEI